MLAGGLCCIGELGGVPTPERRVKIHCGECVRHSDGWRVVV